VIQFLRSLGSELKPPALGPFGLEKALRAHLQAFQTRNPEIQLTLELDKDQQQLPEWARYALFRIYQAAVENVAKHAQATHMRVRLGFDEESVRLTVVDDGQGFDLPASWLDFAYTGRYGLLIMQERVDALRGRMMVQSITGSGTRITVQAPLDQPPLPLSLPMESHVSSSLPSLQSSLPLSGQKTHVPPSGQAPSVPDRNG
jgi:signal transduction histidine kinase